MKKLLKDKEDADKIVNFIKNGTEDKKLREQVSIDLYEKIQSPITSKLEKLEHKIEDAALPIYNKINQLAIEPPTANLLSLDDPFDHPPIKAPPKQKTFKVDIFKDVDKEVLRKYNIPTKDISNEKIQNILEKIIPENFDANTKELTRLTRENKKLSDEYAKKTTTKERKTVIDDLIGKINEKYGIIKNEQEELKKIRANLNSSQKFIVGEGLKQQKRHSYKLTNDGKYGNLTIDLNQLTGFNKLIVTKGSEIIINQNVDDDLIELITKRYNSKKTYSKESEDLFRDLTELSGLPMHKTSSKFKKIIKGCKCDNSPIEYYNDPTELLTKLEIIIGSLKSGNTSSELLNNGINIIDELLQIGYIDKKEHKTLYNKLI